MDLLEIMRTRRSIRSYKNESVSEENITKILEAGLLSASGKAIRPWEFIVVEDKAILEELSNSSPYAKCVAHAPVAIVVVYRTDDLRFPSYAQIDSAIAAENILLAITDL